MSGPISPLSGAEQTGHLEPGNGPSSPSEGAHPSQQDRRAAWREVITLYLGTLAAIKLAITLQESLGLVADVLVIIPLLFIYVPLLWIKYRRVDPHDFGLSLEGWRPALRLNLVLFALIVPPFLLGNHYYQLWVVGKHPVHLLPAHLWTEVVAYHLVFVAFPEEFFYRGYVQSRLNQVYPRTLELFGVRFGPGLLWATLLFTAGHSIVSFRWWHFAILFPALIFAWIRERTGNIVASSLFHAGCNILMVCLETWYGVIKR